MEACRELLSGPLWSLMCCWSESTHSHLMFSLSRYSHTAAPPPTSPFTALTLSSFSPRHFLPTIENTSIAIQSPSHHWGVGSIGALCLKRISLDSCKTLNLPQHFITAPVNFAFTHHLHKNASTNELHQPVVFQERECSNFPLDICTGGLSNATWSSFNQLYMSLS